jgi:hypothetical protein
MVLALAVPAAAFAKKGGVPANGNGNGKSAPAVAPLGDQDEDAPAPVHEKGKGKDKAKGAVEAEEEEAVSDDDATEGDELEADEPADGEESEEPPAKLTGIENALFHLQRNLERKQAKFAAGEDAKLPKGLQATIAKFMSWLGIEPTDDEATEGDGSVETSPTVEPDPIENPDTPDSDAPVDTP